MIIAVLGNGSIGKRHMRNLRDLGYDRLICMDPAAHVKKQIRKLFPQTMCYDTLSDVFIKGRPDIVFVCSPPQHHLRQLKMALDYGCHTFVEKPFSLSTDGAEDVLRRADQNQLKVMTGFNMRHVEPIKKMKLWVDEGRIGRILSCRIGLSSYMPDWHPWEDYRDCFMAFSKSGGGALFDYVHGIDMTQWFAGQIKHLSSIQKTTVLEMETDDVAILIGLTEKGVMFDLYFDFVDRRNRRGIELIGTKGTVSWTLTNQHTLSLYDGEIGESVVVQSRFDWDSCYIESIKEFLRAVDENLPIESDGWNGLNTQEVLTMAIRSNKTGKMVSR